MLLEAQDEEADGDRPQGRGMTDQQVRDEAMTIFLAGHETTANALTWTWYLLSGAPDVEARLHQEVEEHVGQHFRNDVAWNAVLETPGNQRDRDNGGNRVAGDRKQSEKRVETDRADHRQIHRRVHDAGEPLNRSRKFAPGLVLRKTFRSGVGPEMSEAPRRGSRRLLGTLSDACRGSTARDLCQDAADVVSHASRRAIEKAPQNEVTDRPRRREHDESHRELKENVAERHRQGQYASASELCRRMSGSSIPSEEAR